MKNILAENRKNERLDIRGMIIDIAFGNLVFDGTIEDISESGLKTTCLTKKIKILPQKYVTVVSGHNTIFKLVLQPRWFKKNSNDNYQEVGFKILDAPQSWTELFHYVFPEHA